MTRLLRLCAVLLALAAPARAVDITPLLDAQALGGQYFFGRQKGDVSGSGSITFAPAIAVDDRWSVLPALSSSFEGTKEVVDPVGQGTVLSQQLENRVSARGVYETASGKWRLKPFASWRYQLLKETSGEKWGKGLFDDWQWDIGGEAEYVDREPFAARARASYFETRFPNYATLESQGAAQGAGLARPGAGAFTLDSRSAEASGEFELPLGARWVGEGRLELVYSRFPQQRVVAASGLFSDALRQDLVTTWTAGAKLPVELNTDWRGVGGFSLSYAFNTSNQALYDAAQTAYLPLAENWSGWRGGPWAKAFIGPLRRPATLSGSLELGLRRWPHRPAQDETGLYDGDALRQRTWTATASVSYPLGERFSAVATLQWLRATSNQAYQQLYRYDYSATNYLFGFSYSY